MASKGRWASKVAAEALELGFQVPQELLPGLAEAAATFDRPLEALIRNGLALLRSSRWRVEAEAGVVARRIGFWERLQDGDGGDVVDRILDLMGPTAAVRSLQDAFDAHAQLRGPGAPWEQDTDAETIARRVLLELGIEPRASLDEAADDYQEAMPSGAFGAARLASEWELDVDD